MKSTSRSQVLSLYRSLLREAHKLPDPLVKFTYSTYIRNGFRKNARISGENLRYKKIKTAKQKLRQLQAANSGDKTAVARTLSFAYGVTGPIRHQNMSAYKRTGIPPSTTDTRPPPFPPALKALVASPLARIKPGSKNQPDEPMALSLALDKRGWLGKLPERRERNLWWNWWRDEPKRTLVPAEIEVVEPNPGAPSNSPTSVEYSNGLSPNASTSLRLRQLGLPVASTQESGLIRRAEEFSRSHLIPKAPRRSTERTLGAPNKSPDVTTTVPPQSRFMRRRYRELLSKMPLLSFKPSPSSPQTPPIVISDSTSHDQNSTPIVPSGKFDVSISPLAASLGPRGRTTYSVMTQEDRRWIERARELKRTSTPKSGEPRSSNH
ncbi:unnamed protein product [Rhizoctonia solani]|uniref:LYR motif-containing protein Cup1-like N-terminal domain-containing protein n=1 Tax=Rhizoctonia solani TaxID=456999 RepID=A0A8H2ZWK4_9AGAM|nr:unnamed protein product [Rhizoctonia solani]